MVAEPDITTRGVGRIRDSYANIGKKFSIAFIKYFSKVIRQMKGILFIDFLIQKDFLNTRSRQ